MVLAVLAIEYANAETVWTKGNYTFQLEVNNEEKIQTGLNNIHDIIKILGLKIDVGSKIYFHEESNVINLNCFDCYIRRVPSDEIIENSFNEDFPGR